MSEQRDPTTDQPLPTESKHPCIQDLVTVDIEARKQFGIRKYGKPLQPFNGRNAIQDAYEESLDLCMYLRQLAYESSPRFSVARKIMSEAFKKDEHLTQVYISNLAMLMHDQWDITDYEKRNAIARSIMKLLFED